LGGGRYWGKLKWGGGKGVKINWVEGDIEENLKGVGGNIGENLIINI
jgi:hypothetical protein